MKSRIKRIIIIFLLSLLPTSVIIFQSCSKDDIEEAVTQLLSILDQTGWLKDKEEMNNIPDDITPFDNNDQQLQSKVDLSNRFPPVGNQGNYGTCVAWSVGYNLKTALNAIEKDWTSSDLASTSNQTSPKDLWMCIPSSQKGNNCGGTNFEPALDAIITDGVASLSEVPYSSMGSCNGQKKGNAQNKLANYRKIASETEGLTPANFKGYLNAGRPIAIGARLGDRFMNWNSSAVISSDTYNNEGMQHAYHAMVLVGYDDSKNAFRVRNSWGTSWGDGGSIWVDYNFFCNSFCFAAFVAQNVNSISVGSSGVNPNDLSSGYDLLAYSAEDEKMSENDENYQPEYSYRNRRFTYDVYNSGNIIINPSQKWSIIYMYYDATNASTYQVIFEDYYTTEYGSGDGYYDSPNSLAGGWWNNYSVEAGKKVGEAEYGPDGFSISYIMPEITGKYYLVVMADGYDKISEANEDNNFYFITAANGKPLEFQNGNITNTAKSAKMSTKGKRPAPFSNTENQTLVKPGNLNTYTPAELKAMLLHDKKTGKLNAKINAFRAKGSNPHIKKTAKK